MFMLFPRNLPARHTAWVVYGLIAVNTVVFLATALSFGTGEVARRLGFIPAHPTLGTAFTALFLHAGLFHLLGNMLFLWMFGESVEDALGHGQTLVCYLAAGLFGVYVHYLANARSAIPCVGASGAISGVVGMYMVLFPRAKAELNFYLRLWPFHGKTVITSAAVAGAVWLGEQGVLGVLAGITGWSFGVAFLAHVGGLVAGAMLGLLVSRLGLAPAYREMLARKTARSMRCPGCGDRMPRREAGRYCCSGCGTLLCVDEEGNVAARHRRRRESSSLHARATPHRFHSVRPLVVCLYWVRHAWSPPFFCARGLRHESNARSSHPRARPVPSPCSPQWLGIRRANQASTVGFHRCRNGWRPVDCHRGVPRTRFVFGCWMPGRAYWGRRRRRRIAGGRRDT
jgi:membrane associated rhomboid family serine protease